ncbi:MAG: alpha-amylase [Gammaproteobacteria bacterium]|nr:MAG: alpha-amylase [Gammaproteobacteria bacterium]
MSIANQMRGLPMSELIGGPLHAAAMAQFELAKNMTAFIGDIGFDGDKTRTINFDLQRPVDNGSGTISKESIHIEAPLLGLVPIPALLIETVNVDFTMEVKSSSSSKSSTDASAEVKAKGGWGWGSVEFTGSVSTSKENTRTTDNSAKYNVSVVAKQQPPAEGMSKLMDLMASCVEPLTATTGGNG